jgi:branched-chain amino acid transport system permease protein
MSARRNAAWAVLRDAFLSALVALGLFGAMIGLKTESGADRLFLIPRPGLVAIAVAIVFFGRLVMGVWRIWRPAGTPSPHRLTSVLARSGRFVAPLLLVLAVTLPFYGGRYWLDLGVLVLTYVMLGWGLNIVVGLAGLLDLGYVAFYAVGAYSYALLAQDFGLGFWTALPLAGLFAA